MSLSKIERRKKLVRNSRPSFLEVASCVLLKSLTFPASNRVQSSHLVRQNYVRSLSSSYNAIAIDYDGTCISLRNRGGSPSQGVIRPLQICLENGLPLVIITGRGKSLLTLRSSFNRFDQDL